MNTYSLFQQLKRTNSTQSSESVYCYIHDSEAMGHMHGGNLWLGRVMILFAFVQCIEHRFQNLQLGRDFNWNESLDSNSFC